jgi:hypothetical protein
MDVNEFAQLVLAQQKARLARLYSQEQADWETVEVIPGPKYTKVNLGPASNMSGKFMIENSTGIIYGIKGYGKVHKGHVYGTLDTVDAYDWSDYTPERLASLQAVTDDDAQADPYGNLAAERAVDAKASEPKFAAGDRVLWTGSSPRPFSQDVNAPGRITGAQDTDTGRVYYITLDDKRHVSANASQLRPEAGQVDRAHTVTHTNGITQVFRTPVGSRAAGESAIGAYQEYRAGDYRTYAPDGSSLGCYATEVEAFGAVRANDGRYTLAGVAKRA